MRVLTICFSLLGAILCTQCDAQTQGDLRSDSIEDFGKKRQKLIEISASMERVSMWLTAAEGKHGAATGTIRLNSLPVDEIRVHFGEIQSLYDDDLRIAVSQSTNSLIYTCRSGSVALADNLLRTWVVGYRAGRTRKLAPVLLDKEPLLGPLYEAACDPKRLTIRAISNSPKGVVDLGTIAQHISEIRSLFGSEIRITHSESADQLLVTCPEDLVDSATSILQAWMSGFECGFLYQETSQEFVRLNQSPESPIFWIDVPLYDLRKPQRQKMLDALFSN